MIFSRTYKRKPGDIYLREILMDTKSYVKYWFQMKEKTEKEEEEKQHKAQIMELKH